MTEFTKARAAWLTLEGLKHELTTKRNKTLAKIQNQQNG